MSTLSMGKFTYGPLSVHLNIRYKNGIISVQEDAEFQMLQLTEIIESLLKDMRDDDLKWANKSAVERAKAGKAVFEDSMDGELYELLKDYFMYSILAYPHKVPFEDADDSLSSSSI